MPAPGKWFIENQIDRPAGRTARRCLRTRWRWLLRMLNRTTRTGGASVTDVHQLRVAARRAGTAAELFEPLWPAGIFQSVFKGLKQLRRAAGKARDWDVLWLDCRDRNTLNAPPKSIRRALRHECKRARKPLGKLRCRLAEKCYFAAALQVFNQVIVEPNFSYDMLRIEIMRRMEQVFITASEHEFHTLAELHEFRLQVKSYRYAIELFAGPVPMPALVELYGEVTELQSELGALNDQAVAIELLDRLMEKCSGRKAVKWLAEERSRREIKIAELHREFLCTWSVRNKRLKAAWHAVTSIIIKSSIADKIAAASLKSP